jgi:hypothetical protein
MTRLQTAAVSLGMAIFSLGAWAQTAAEHTQHHPATANAKTAKATPAQTSARARATDTMKAMDGQMKSMREMHEKMMAAKTPEERKALMGDHMKAMQDGMSMMEKMNSMGGMQDKGGMPMDMMGMHTMMEKRMEMMTTMMQMMMDRMPFAPAQ